LPHNWGQGKRRVMDGVLNINKSSGMTSHDVVLHVRRMFKEKRVGHTGTLDPSATGVLVLCLGKATRIAQYLEAGEKEYQAVLRLGVITDTLDAEGRVLETRTYIPPDRSRILDALQRFTGNITQIPPAYSALKIGGVPSYKLARQGKALPLKARQVIIHDIQLISYDDPWIKISVRCSKGVYIRSLCADLGEAWGCGAHLANLVRTRSGRFRIEEGATLDRLSNYNPEELNAALVPIDNALDDMPAITVNESDSIRILHGNRIEKTANAIGEEGLMVRIHDEAGRFLAIARKGSGILKPEIVFS